VTTTEPDPEKDEEEEENNPNAPVFDAEGYVQDREGYVLSYCAVRARKRLGRKLGRSDCVVGITELLNMVGAAIVESSETKADHFMDLSRYCRQDAIAKNGRAIAAMVGNSIVDASAVARGNNEEADLCKALEPYAAIIFGEIG